MKVLIAISLMTFSSFLDLDGSKLADIYVEKYYQIAIQEMQRTRIPASIKLAQGLLESDWGRSPLANVANNHFGIKCGSHWLGGTFYKEDDDRNSKGELIESCFRAFDHPLHSYMAHSNFLLDPKKEYRYGFLFNYASTDYKAWALGLKDAGYATDPQYPQKLINIIEKYELYKFDEKIEASNTTEEQIVNVEKNNSKRLLNKRTEETSSPPKKEKEKLKGSHLDDLPVKKTYNSILAYEIFVNNETRMVVAKGGESIKQIANANGLSDDNILIFNEIYTSPTDKLVEGEIIYIEKKKRSYKGLTDFHIVTEGETMESIAQRYGMRVANLYAKNRMPKGSKTIPGIHLSLKKTVSTNRRPRFIIEESNRAHKFLFEDTAEE